MIRPLKAFGTSSLRVQGGWTVLEAAIGLGILGLMMAMVVLVTNKLSTGVSRAERTAQVQQAQFALLGYAQANARLPAPKDATPSVNHPGYVEGWLPANELGIAGGSGRLRYIVDEKLTAAPQIFNPDALGLLGTSLAPRTTPNGLDLCALMVRRETSSMSLKGGMRAAFGVQSAVLSSGSSPGAAGALPLFYVEGAAPPDVEIETTLEGFGEALGNLGCLQKLTQVANRVRTLAALQDMRVLTAQEVRLSELGVRQATDSRTNAIWRMTNWTISQASFVFQLGLTALGMQTTPMALIGGTLGMATYMGVIAAIGVMQDITGDSIESSAPAIAAAKQSHQAAEQRLGAIDAEIEALTIDVNKMIARGIE